MASLDCEVIMIKKVLIDFVLKNWKAILIVSLLAVLMLKFGRDYRLMQKAYEIQSQSHEAQIEGLKEIHRSEIIEKQLLMENHLESLASIEREYEITMKELEEEKRMRRGEIIRKFSEDKEELVKDIETTFGFEYVP
jgi:hypothetical protein